MLGARKVAKRSGRYGMAGISPAEWSVGFFVLRGPGRFAAHRRQHLLDLPDAAAQRQRRHLEVGVCADAAIFPGEELRYPAQFRQLPLQTAQVLLSIAALPGWFNSADRIKQGAGHIEQLLVLLDLVGVL